MCQFEYNIWYTTTAAAAAATATTTKETKYVYLVSHLGMNGNVCSGQNKTP